MNETVSKFFKDGKLTMMPKKHHVKLEVLAYFHHFFQENKNYSEQEVNDVIKQFYTDFALVRRALIDYKFLERDDQGKVYKKIIK